MIWQTSLTNLNFRIWPILPHKKHFTAYHGKVQVSCENRGKRLRFWIIFKTNCENLKLNLIKGVNTSKLWYSMVDEGQNPKSSFVGEVFSINIGVLSSRYFKHEIDIHINAIPTPNEKILPHNLETALYDPTPIWKCVPAQPNVPMAPAFAGLVHPGGSLLDGEDGHGHGHASLWKSQSFKITKEDIN